VAVPATSTSAPASIARRLVSTVDPAVHFQVDRLAELVDLLADRLDLAQLAVR
jgi:hypothetical protein